MGAAVIGGIIAAAGAITAGAINAASQKSANDTNREIADEQMAYQTAEREAAQVYNTPEAQRKRYEQAGINPFLALGNITPGTTQAQTSPGMAQVNPVDYSGIFQGMNAGMDTYNKFQETESMQLGIERDRIDTTYKLSEKLLELEEARSRIANSKTDLKTKNKQLENLDVIQKQLLTDLDFSRGTLDERKAAIKKQNKLMDLDAKNKELVNQYQQFQNDLQPLQRKVLAATLHEIGSRINLNNASTQTQYVNQCVMYAQESLTNEQKRGFKIENDQKKEYLDIVRDTAKQEFKAKKWDADHPSYFDKFLASGQRLGQTLGQQKEVPAWTPEATSRW